MRSLFNIIIPTYNNKEELYTCLSALNQQGQGDRVCICVDGSTDGTFEMISTWNFEHLETLVLHHEGRINRGRAATRNLGIKHLLHPNTLFLDSDMIPKNDLLVQHASFLEKHPISGGKIRITGGKWANYCNSRGIFKFQHESICPSNYFLTGNTALRTDCLGNIRFDEQFSTFGGEDADFGLMLEKAGFQLRYNSNAESKSKDKQSIGEALDRLETFGKTGLAVLVAKYPNLDWYRISRKNRTLYFLFQKKWVQKVLEILGELFPQEIANNLINVAVISAVQRGYNRRG